MAEKNRYKEIEIRLKSMEQEVLQLKQIREKQSLFINLMEHASDAIFIVNADSGQILDVNEKACSSLGYKKEELLEMRVIDIEDELPTGFSWQSHVRSVRKKGSVLFAGAHRRKDGSIFPVEVNVRYVKIKDLNYIVGVARDMSQRHDVEKMWRKSHAVLELRVQERTMALEKMNAELQDEMSQRRHFEEALSMSEEKCRKLFENATDSIFIINPESGSILDCNESAAKKLGYTKEELKNLKVFDINRPGAAEEIRHRFKKQREGKNLVFETSHRRKDGTYIPVEISRNFVHYAHEQVIMDLSRDITDRKEAEDALRASEEKYRSVLENIGIGVMVINPDLHILAFNRQMKEWFPHIDVNKKRICYEAYSLPPRKRSCPTCPTKETFEDGEVHESIIETATDNQMRHYRILSSPIKDENGKISSVIELVEDVTERYRAEEELKESREQLRALADRMLAVREEERKRIARDVHDELGQILTVLNFDLSWMEEKLTPDQKPIVEKIHQSLELVDNAIDTIHSTASALRPTILDNLGIVAAIDWQARGFEKRTGIKCELFFASHNMDMEEALAINIFRIFQEALTNIARHSKATKVAISLKRVDSKLILEVKDNGRGINKKEIEDTKSFGLIGMRERVYPWRGEVTFIGKKGKGTTITAIIPLINEEV